MIDLTLTCPECGRRADVCFEHGDAWKKRRRAVYPVCPHCRQRIINPGGHAEACPGPGPEVARDLEPTWTMTLAEARAALLGEKPVQVELVPDHEIDPTTQVDRTPGIDAICEREQGPWWECGWPFCDCFVRGGS